MAKMSIQERIERTLNNSTAKVFVRKEFDKFGSYDQVGRVLRSMMAKGLLVKAGYGIYVKAKKSSVTGNNVPAIPLEQIGREALQGAARRGEAVGRHGDDRVRALHRHPRRAAGGLREALLQGGEIRLRACRLHGDLRQAGRRRPVDREAGRVRPPIRHGDEHVGEQRAELRLQGGVLQEQSDDAAHGTTSVAGSPGA